MERGNKGIPKGYSDTRSGIEYSIQDYKKAIKKRREEEEAKWASLNGPVISNKDGI